MIRPLRRVLLPFLVALLALAAAAPAFGADVPSKRTLSEDGPTDRYLVDGTWRFRLDPPDQGVRRRYQRSSSSAGWTKVAVPNAWNAGDDSLASMTGTVGWYRKDFKLPSARRSLTWLVRFESVNYRARVWLNGRPIGEHEGAYLPFELRLDGLKRRGTNRLVVRVDNRRRPGDIPPATFRDDGTPLGGWWNYGGLLREVYLRKVDRVDLETVEVRPTLGAIGGAATVREAVLLRNYSGRRQRVSVSGTFGRQSVRIGRATLRPGGTAVLAGRTRVRSPELWAPGSPTLYRARVAARVGGRTVAEHRYHSGIRKIQKTRDGRLLLNGRVLSFRGAGLHEDSPTKGFALDNADRARLIAAAKDLGATALRAHYPLHPELLELADREGLLVWSEVPVYSIRSEVFNRVGVRKRAVREVEQSVTVNRNHPSVLLWSISNELSSTPNPAQGAYIKRAVAAAKRLDPTRPVGLAIAAYPSTGCQPRYAPLDVIGFNTYFGWYTGSGGQIADRDSLSPYLDQVRRCYPGKALVVSEFGVEANRPGPVEEKGTYAFQEDWINFTLGVFASKPWLSGAMYWALWEFRVRPGWDGGNPRPMPPIHNKGLISFAGQPKPAFYDVQRAYRAWPQLAQRPLERPPGQ